MLVLKKRVNIMLHVTRTPISKQCVFVQIASVVLTSLYVATMAKHMHLNVICRRYHVKTKEVCMLLKKDLVVRLHIKFLVKCLYVNLL